MNDLGTILKTEREKKSINLRQVEEDTGIRCSFIKAIEEGKYDVLPGEVYLKGFIRNYGNYLGLDGSKLVQLYNDSVASKNKVETTVIEADLAQSSSNKWLIAALAFCLLITVAGGIFLWKGNSAVSSEKQSDRTAQTTYSTRNQNNSTRVQVAPGTQNLPQSAVKSNKPVIIVVRFTDKCWTSVIADGRIIYEGVPSYGETLVWEADRRITVSFGNAAAAEVTFNGVPVGKLGEKGIVIEKTFIANPTSTPMRP